MKNRRGFTLLEMIMTAAVLSLVALASAPLIKSVLQGMTSTEANLTLKEGGQKALNSIEHQLIQSKRLFSSGDDSYWNAIENPPPAVVTGSTLPAVVSNGVLSPGTTGFVQSGVGNSLFFAGAEPAVDISTNGRTSRIDVYRFHYYVLAYGNASISGQRGRDLWEWHSVPYADVEELNAIGNVDFGQLTSIVQALQNLDPPIQNAWAPSQTADNAFYSLTGSSLLLQGVPRINRDSANKMMNLITGITGGYRYSISPNMPSANHPVPAFAAANLDFPSGFEVLIVGPASARQVFVRLVLAAQGAFVGTITNEQVLLTSVRDFY